MGSFMLEERWPFHGEMLLAATALFVAACAPDMSDMTAYRGHTVGRPDLPWAAGPP